MAAPVKTRARVDDGRADAFPVIEIFGPTIQGEGPDAGRPAYFVRFGGCDYRCSWCDSLYAVVPAEVRAHAERLTVAEIGTRLADLPVGPSLVILSGGNPALLELDPLVTDLQRTGHEVAVETQGSRWRDWLGAVDRLVISPKPPSSGMTDERRVAEFEDFMVSANESGVTSALKIVVFDGVDLAWAEKIHAKFSQIPCFLSVGTDQEVDDESTIAMLRTRFRWLAEEVARRPALVNVRVLPQLHVVAWGTARGV
jgi:7-carboxy-7-deazaguanine synthase